MSVARGPGITRFRVSTRQTGDRLFVSVTVYDDLARRRRDGDRIAGVEGHFEHALGGSHVWHVSEFDGDGDLTGERTVGIVRLWRGALGVGVITHEVTHIACGIYLIEYQPTHGPPSDSMENEEVLCHLVGQLTSRVVNRLHHYGFYS